MALPVAAKTVCEIAECDARRLPADLLYQPAFTAALEDVEIALLTECDEALIPDYLGIKSRMEHSAVSPA